MLLQAIFLTDETPFPPTDGRKVPVANYAWELERRGFDVAIVTAVFTLGSVALSAVLHRVGLRDEPY